MRTGTINHLRSGHSRYGDRHQHWQHRVRLLRRDVRLRNSHLDAVHDYRRARHVSLHIFDRRRHIDWQWLICTMPTNNRWRRRKKQNIVRLGWARDLRQGCGLRFWSRCEQRSGWWKFGRTQCSNFSEDYWWAGNFIQFNTDWLTRYRPTRYRPTRR